LADCNNNKNNNNYDVIQRAQQVRNIWQINMNIIIGKNIQKKIIIQQRYRWPRLMTRSHEDDEYREFDDEKLLWMPLNDNNFVDLWTALCGPHSLGIRTVLRLPTKTNLSADTHQQGVMSKIMDNAHGHGELSRTAVAKGMHSGERKSTKCSTA